MAKEFNNQTPQDLAEVLGGITPSAGAIPQSLLALTMREAMARSEYAVTSSAALYGAANVEDRLRQERDEARKVAGELLALLRLADDAMFDPAPKFDVPMFKGAHRIYLRSSTWGKYCDLIRP